MPGVPLPEELYRLDTSRVIGLTIDPDRLMMIRRQRMGRIGVSERTDYTDPSRLDEEMLAARKVFRSGGFSVINMTDRTIESGADEIIKRVGRISE
ncbi:MAG TPA: kinase/pyrophosphorylase [Deltaproteobacteria bacterium]|nr:kinase/pyrophosphorylase [Pseudomonadota bacterium]HNR51889.1 kinase/pyrophosphorylase [Deltaproteobacteria bacterium]